MAAAPAKLDLIGLRAEGQQKHISRESPRRMRGSLKSRCSKRAGTAPARCELEGDGPGPFRQLGAGDEIMKKTRS